jgi:uncharacterized membrane protein
MPATAALDRHVALRRRLRIGLGVFFIVAGAAHFAMPRVYEIMMPPWLPWHGALIALSGLAEIAGGIGILTTRFRRPAAWGLVALLVAVFPANIHLALDPEAAAAFLRATTPPALADASASPRLLMILRLPLQAVFIACVWWTCQRPPAATTTRA